MEWKIGTQGHHINDWKCFIKEVTEEVLGYGPTRLSTDIPSGGQIKHTYAQYVPL